NNDSENEEGAAERLPWRLVGAVMSGTLLNPLNSSMIAVALLSLRADFLVNTVTVTWLLSGFYLAASIGMPLMGRLADQFGPRRIFTLGLLLVGVTGALAPLAPAFGWLLVIRIVQAFGTAAAYPSGLAIIRSNDRGGRAPAAALGAISIASSVSAALGPVLGGGLVALASWPAIFLINVPVIIVGLILARRWLPPDAAPGLASGETVLLWRDAVRTLDLPGAMLFGALLVSVLGFLLSLSSRPLWLLLPFAGVAAILFLVREYRVATPFVDLRLLVGNRSLVGIYAQFAAVNLVFYSVFFGLPLWLEEARRFAPGTAGLLLLPVAGIGVLATPLAARLIDRSGPRSSLIVGAVLLLVGSLLLLLLNTSTPVLVLLVVGAVLGVPNGFNNLGLQAALYEIAPANQMGAAGGLFQTFRYTGAILSTALIGIVLGPGATSATLHTLAILIAAVSTLLVVASVITRSSSVSGRQVV
ncbi:MAG: MFS transporter, partial [Chloroflexota bacterium]|nr:MFS transporter [Chloroflexota bacterium]